MVLFMSQAPILPALVAAMLLVALLELIGLTVRRNIAMLSLLSLLCLGAAPFISGQSSDVAALLYAIGAVLAIILALYVLATARRGRQWTWFTAFLLAVVATLAGDIAARVMLAQQDAAGAAVALFTLTFVPPVCALAYGLLAPDIPKPRGGS